jgi:hypothetical protein
MLTDGSLPLDLRQLLRARLAHGQVSWAGGAAGDAAIGFGLDLSAARFTVDYLADGLPVSESIGLCSTPCNFGGVRWWVRCPDCDRRIAVLYLKAGRFRCRACHGLTYTSSRETPFNRACRRVQKLRRHLGAFPGMADPLPPKPRGMWARTFARRCAAIDAADRRALALAGVGLDRA